MAKKKPGKKKKKLTWGCPNSGRAFNLDTLVDMLQNTSGFATFFFPVLKEAMSNNPTAKACVDSYLAPTDQELMDLGIPADGVAGKRTCTESGLLVAMIAEQNASSTKR